MLSHTPLPAFPLVDVPSPLNLHGGHTSQLMMQVLSWPANDALVVCKWYANNRLKIRVYARHAAPVMQVMELMVRDMGQLTHIECSVKRAKWTQVLAVLKLSPTQQDQLMANRKEHLNKLRKVYQERQELNMQVGARSVLSRLREVGCQLQTGVSSDESRDSMIKLNFVVL